MAVAESVLQVAVRLTCSLLLLNNFSQPLLRLLQRLCLLVVPLLDALLLLLLGLTGLVQRLNYFPLICQLTILVV